MPYYFDTWGWLSETVIEGRSTNVVPPAPADIPEGHAANFTGHKWVVVPYTAPPPPVPPVLASPTRRQLKLVMLQAGLLDAVEYAVANSGDRALQIEWAEALEFDRDNPSVATLAAALGKTDEEIDALWALARSL